MYTIKNLFPPSSAEPESQSVPAVVGWVVGNPTSEELPKALMNPLALILPEEVIFVPLTISPSLLNVPAFTISSEKTSNTGTPDISVAAKRDPDNESVTENRDPWLPCTENSVEPEPATLILGTI